MEFLRGQWLKFQSLGYVTRMWIIVISILPLRGCSDARPGEKLQGLWVGFLLAAILGSVTWVVRRYSSKKILGYIQKGFVAYIVVGILVGVFFLIKIFFFDSHAPAPAPPVPAIQKSEASYLKTFSQGNNIAVAAKAMVAGFQATSGEKLSDEVTEKRTVEMKDCITKATNQWLAAHPIEAEKFTPKEDWVKMMELVAGPCVESILRPTNPRK